MTWNVPLKEIENFYDSKTQALLHRYGPGPRVHYHAGVFDKPEPLDAPPDMLKQGIRASQERLLDYAASTWNASTMLCGDVLDAGCGLGGGSLFWAQKFGAQVTGVTIAASHIPLITQFAAQAGVSSHIHPQVCNVVEMPGKNLFDAAVAIESSCHMPRQALFDRLAVLVRPGGRIFIADFFSERPEYEHVSRRHWHAPIGTLNEYRHAAQMAGFQEEKVEDISLRTAHFWALTAALVQAENCERELSAKEAQKLEESLSAHLLVQRGLATGGMQYRLLSFIKEQ